MVIGIGSATDSDGNTSETFQPPEEDTPPKKRRLVSATVSKAKDAMPVEYRHIRTGARKVRPEYYETVDKLKCCYHMSQTQAEAAVTEVGNKMFGRKWKFHSESVIIDADTLPATRSARLVGKSLEVLAMAEIVNEILSSDEKATVTYSDDGSKKQGAGAFTVKGINVNGKYRSLPTLGVSSESKANLAELKKMTLLVLETASGVPSKDLFERIDFVITDQTAHNFGVEEIVAEDLGSLKAPDHLFCNVHPSLMFNRIITKHWASLENAIGRDKIYSNFLVNATTNASSVTEQALDCMTRLINHDFDHKPWNKSHEFDIHISPKENKSVSLKDERFNRLTLTCAVALYHYDDVVSFLEKYEHVTNQLACIVRSFQDLNFLKVLFCVGALIGLHLVDPFLSLTTSSETKYSKLIPAFKELYDNLRNTVPKDILQVTKPAYNFISEERFDSTKYDESICSEISKVIDCYYVELEKMFLIILPALTKGFEHQKGAIFGFGEEDKESDHALSKMNPEKLENAPIHNLDAERSVGFVNYELSRRGAKELGAVSSIQVKAKAKDLIEKRPSGSFRQYGNMVRKRGQIQDIFLKWNDQQQELKLKGLQDKEIANLSADKRKNKDLTTLKGLGGPFTTSQELKEYLDSNLPLEDKISRMYTEIRWARDTSLSLPKTSDIFRLMRDHKKLPLDCYAKNLYLEKN